MATEPWWQAARLLHDAGPVPHTHGLRVPDRPSAGRRGSTSGVSHLAAWWSRLLFAGLDTSPQRRAERHYGVPADRGTLRAPRTRREHDESQLFDLLVAGLTSRGKGADATTWRSLPARFARLLQRQVPARVGAAVRGAAELAGAAGCRLCRPARRGC